MNKNETSGEMSLHGRSGLGVIVTVGLGWREGVLLLVGRLVKVTDTAPGSTSRVAGPQADITVITARMQPCKNFWLTMDQESFKHRVQINGKNTSN